MATCPAEALIAQNPCLLELSGAEMRTVWFGAIQQWALAGNPALDTSIQTLLSANPCLLELSQAELRTVIAGQLCVISGG